MPPYKTLSPVFGAIEPKSGDNVFLVMPDCNTDMMNLFLDRLSEEYKNDIILLVCDGASWHKSKGLSIPKNIFITHIPPYTPEMNPIKQIWKKYALRGLRMKYLKRYKM